MQQQTNNDIDGKIDGHDIIPKDEEEPEPKSLIHWFNESHSINDLGSIIVEIALAEGFNPLGIFQDTYSEEMNILTLFFGFSRAEEITKKITYQKNSKWELMYKDNDFSTHITNFFFKAIKIII